MTEHEKTRIALLGTGLMGRPMAEKLLAAGYPVTAYNRTREKALPLVELGAVVVDHPHQAIEAGEGVLVILADEPAIRETVLERRSRKLGESHELEDVPLSWRSVSIVCRVRDREDPASVSWRSGEG